MYAKASWCTLWVRMWFGWNIFLVCAAALEEISVFQAGPHVMLHSMFSTQATIFFKRLRNVMLDPDFPTKATTIFKRVLTRNAGP